MEEEDRIKVFLASDSIQGKTSTILKKLTIERLVSTCHIVLEKQSHSFI